MYLIHRKLVFIAHPKMASRAIRDRLQKLGSRSIKSHHEIDLQTILAQKKQGAVVTCVMRDPFDVLVSWYYHTQYRGENRDNPMEFKPWLAQLIETGNGYVEHGMFPGYRHSNMIMRYTHLGHDWERVCQRARIKHTILQRVGESKDRVGRSAMDYYDTESTDWVTEHFATDLAQWRAIQ